MLRNTEKLMFSKFKRDFNQACPLGNQSEVRLPEAKI
jgi:hypothetical protein